MCDAQHPARRDEDPWTDPQENWRREQLRSPAEAGRVLQAVEAGMKARGYADNDLFAVRLALEEAISNALKHGHRGDARKCVPVRYQITTDEVVAEVVDEARASPPMRWATPLPPRT